MKRWGWILVLALWPSLVFAADQNTLTWTRETSANEQGFNIYRAVGACPQTTLAKVGSVAAGVLTYVDTAVTEGTTYCYDVTAYNSAGESAASNQAGRLVPFVTPSVPSALQVGP